MRFKLVEDINLLNEGYELLWKQFEQVADIKCKNYDLHHIYNDTSSLNAGDINFVLLPSKVHKHLPTKQYREDAISVYKYLKATNPEHFKTISVSFEVFMPEDINSIADKQKKINNKRRNSRRNKYKKPSTAEIIDEVEKEGVPL